MYVCMYVFSLFNSDSVSAGVTVNLQPQVSAVAEGGTYVANITVEPTTLMATFDVIVQTYFCDGCNGANRKQQYLLTK